MKQLLVLLALCAAISSPPVYSATVGDLRCEYLQNPLGVETAKPCLSWIIASAQRGERQRAYRVLVASSQALLAKNRGDLWDSGKVASSASVGVEYAGAPLGAGTVAYWQAQVWGEKGRASAWSVPARFSIGLLRPADWSAQWIGMGGATEQECPWLRKSFTLARVPDSALAYVGSIGFHELYINGRKVGDQVLTPSVSDLQKRALYLTYDIKPYLKPGPNLVALWLAPGWGQFNDGNPAVDFKVEKSALGIAQLQFGTGHRPFTRLVSDASWRCARSSTTHLGAWHNHDFGGDRVDANAEQPGWNDVNYDASGWEKVTVYQPGRVLSADVIEPNRKCEKIVATQMAQTGPGKYRFVMAKLYAGWVEVALRGVPGTKITIHVSSLPDKEEEYNERDEYVLGVSGVGTFCNRFSYHEVGYVTIEGLSQPPAVTDVVGYRISNDRPRVGSFDCSNALLKKIYDITVNNYQNLSTGGMTVDCPHRERLGYGGDGHTSLEIALDTFSSDAFFAKWAQDWCDIQQPDGKLYNTAPTMGGGGGPGWGGFVVTMPWAVYQTYGDRRILEKTYPTARRWLGYLDQHVGADGLLEPLPGGYWVFLGDWLAPGRSEGASTPEALLFNNCYYLYATRLTAKIAGVLGHPDDATRLLAHAAGLQAAINKHFLNPTTKAYLDTRQTHCVMPLVAGAVAPEDTTAVMRNLEKEILVTREGHLDTGLHGTYFMTKYLTEHERSDLIFTYATQTTAPSYGDLIAKGYTTWPEMWEGAPSKLHGCLNGIGGWFARGVAGIRPDETAPGFARFIIRPAIVGDLTWATASFDSPHGRIVSAWKRVGGRLTMDVTIPANTTATVYIPARNAASVTESGKPSLRTESVQFLRQENGTVVFAVASGSYQFSTSAK